MADPQTGTESLKRLNLNLTPERLARLQLLAKRRGTTVSNVVRSALHLIETVDSEISEGRRLAVIDDGDRVVKEFIIVE